MQVLPTESNSYCKDFSRKYTTKGISAFERIIGLANNPLKFDNRKCNKITLIGIEFESKFTERMTGIEIIRGMNRIEIDKFVILALSKTVIDSGKTTIYFDKRLICQNCSAIYLLYSPQFLSVCVKSEFAFPVALLTRCVHLPTDNIPFITTTFYTYKKLNRIEDNVYELIDLIDCSGILLCNISELPKKITITRGEYTIISYTKSDMSVFGKRLENNSYFIPIDPLNTIKNTESGITLNSCYSFYLKIFGIDKYDIYTRSIIL